MGNVIQLREPEVSEEVITVLRTLLQKARTGEITGLAFVAMKPTTICFGVVDIDDPIQALDAAETLIDALNGNTDHLVEAI
jgi:hypothetical protein